MPISLCRQGVRPFSEESDEGNSAWDSTQLTPFQQAFADHLVYYQSSPLASISVSDLPLLKEIAHGPNR